MGAAPGLFARPGTLTALTTFILIVGVVYQVVLRQTWSPVGLQRLVDELLHTVIPPLVLLYWVLFAGRREASWRACGPWLLYPLAYLALVLIRGAWSGFYRSWRACGPWLLYPLAYLALVLIRGAWSGFYPYPWRSPI